MKKWRLLHVALALLIASSIAAQFNENGPGNYVDYWSDNTFTVRVGMHDVDCEGSTSESGTTSSYKSILHENCLSGGGHLTCHELVNGTWTLISCPDGFNP